MMSQKTKFQRWCHPDDRKDLAVSLAKSLRGILRVAQNDTRRFGQLRYYNRYTTIRSIPPHPFT